MSKIAIIYWSGTGNTEMMAEAIGSGATSKGERELFPLAEGLPVQPGRTAQGNGDTACRQSIVLRRGRDGSG